MNRNIVTADLPNGIRVICMAARKFKTISLALFLHHELRADLATANALLPAVLERGNRRHPDNPRCAGSWKGSRGRTLHRYS